MRSNKNAHTICWTVWDAMKALLRVKFVAVNSHMRKTEQAQMNNLMLFVKLLEKEAKPKAQRRYKIMEIRRVIDTMKIKKKYKELKSWFFIRFISLSCRVALAKVCRTILNVVVIVDILILF